MSTQDTIDSAVELLGKRVTIIWKTPEGEVGGVVGTLMNIRPSGKCPGTELWRPYRLHTVDAEAEVPVEQVTEIQAGGEE